MSPLSDPALTSIARDLASQRVERKRNASNRSAIRRNICAFANDLRAYNEPGVILIGIEDELLRELAQMRLDGNIPPLPAISVEKRTVEGCEIAVVVVQPSKDTPVRYQGRVWVRVGPTVQLAMPEDERRLAEKRRESDLPFDFRTLDLEIGVLGCEYIQRKYIPAVISR